MNKCLIEYFREQAILKLFTTPGFNDAWSSWQPIIRQKYLPELSSTAVFNLGEHLKDIFHTTSIEGRSQSSLSKGGSNWEALVCYYLNLCLIGRRTVVIKHSKSLLPTPISDAISVNYKTFVSNTESDLIALTFPDKDDYSCSIDTLPFNKTVGKNIKFDMIGALNNLCARDFDDIEIHIIQCKTNWNDNAQIPMLWDMVYSSKGFNNSVKVGRNNYDLLDKVNAKPPKFSYSFVTVPTVNTSKIKTNSTCVQRVRNLSGGNYWGLPSQSGIADSVKEMISNNLLGGHHDNLRKTLANELKNFNTNYSYFKL